MDWGSLNEDQLDRIIGQSEQEIAGWRVVEMAAIREKKSRQSHHADGYRSIVDWVAARADISALQTRLETATGRAESRPRCRRSGTRRAVRVLCLVSAERRRGD
jgi:hypothetical protein